VTQNPKEIRANVGVLTEQHGLYMRMTGEEYLEFFGRVYGLDPRARKARSDYLLQYFGIAEAAHRRCGEY
jgi:ABC-type Na+ transport system ATPase subunit NatA